MTLKCKFYQEYNIINNQEVCRTSLNKFYFFLLLLDGLIFLLLYLFEVDYALWFCLGFAICIGIVLIIIQWQKNKTSLQHVSNIIESLLPPIEE